MKLLSVDIETGGLDINCSFLEIAAVQLDVPTGALETFRQVVKPHPLVIESEALKMHSDNLLLDDAMEHGQSLEAVAKQLKHWLFNLYHGEQAVVIGQNFAGFDGPRILHHLKIKTFWHHRIIDAKQLWMRPDDGGIPLIDECCRRAGLPVEPAEHRAMPDAMLTLELYKRWRNG
jgi:DNA polymerase III epsilon subunit-like protein